MWGARQRGVRTEGLAEAQNALIKPRVEMAPGMSFNNHIKPEAGMADVSEKTERQRQRGTERRRREHV